MLRESETMAALQTLLIHSADAHFARKTNSLGFNAQHSGVAAFAAFAANRAVVYRARWRGLGHPASIPCGTLDEVFGKQEKRNIKRTY